MTMDNNYFEFFGISPAFFPDEKALRQKYYEISKSFHPDYYTLADEQKQNEVLELTSLNNKAFTILSGFESRVFYILSLYFDMKEESGYAMDPEFLSDMMDFNEKLMDAQMDEDMEVLQDLKKEIQEMLVSADANIKPEMLAFDQGNRDENILKKVRDYYFKRKYILRIQENIPTFAGL
jgi:molecular chaperone HscB